jgi:hypothetical protein
MPPPANAKLPRNGFPRIRRACGAIRKPMLSSRTMNNPHCLSLSIDNITIEDEPSFRHVGLYADLKKVLRRQAYQFRVLPPALARWDHALFLSLTYWGEADGDVLVDRHVPADVITHIAWHRLAAQALAIPGQAPSADALFFAEAIASAFDVYLVGRLLSHAPDSDFLATQVPAMAESADAAGLSTAEFEALLASIAADPERAFEDLRELLFDAATALLACSGVDAALTVLARLDAHRFGPLLHRYELSNWLLHVRTHAKETLAPDATMRALDQRLRQEKDALEWLTTAWVVPALG